MFNSILAIEDSFDTQPDPDCTPDTDAGSLLAAVGMPAHAIRELLASQGRTGADG